MVQRGPLRWYRPDKRPTKTYAVCQRQDRLPQDADEVRVPEGEHGIDAERGSAAVPRAPDEAS